MTGEICFPTLEIPEEYDFGTIPIGSSSATHIMVKNITFMVANFSWEFLEEEFTVEYLSEVSSIHRWSFLIFTMLTYFLIVRRMSFGVYFGVYDFKRLFGRVGG